MVEKDLFIIIIKVFLGILLLIYFLVGILIARQVFLMNRAIKTKLAGLLNCIALVHIILILLALVYVIIV